MRIAIVIPAYNEAATLRAVVQRALAVCPQVIVVDDGSTDGSAGTLRSLPVVLCRHGTNLGKAASLWTGFAAALAREVDLVVTLDGDGQHQPEDVPRLVAAARRHPGAIVIGARLRERRQAPCARRIANAVADFWLSWAAGQAVADSQSGQRAYPAPLLRALVAGEGVRHDRFASFTLESEILIVAARRGWRTVSVPIETVYRAGARPSHFRPVRDIGRIVRMVVRHLLALRLHPAGLWRSIARPPTLDDGAQVAAHRAPPGASAAPPAAVEDGGRAAAPNG